MSLYQNVRELCKKNNTNIHALEKELDFPRSSLCKWDTHDPSVRKVKRVADRFNVTIESLLEVRS